MEDLLRASAEVLGSGSFGSSYKAVLAMGPALVVKRFRSMNNVGREEFQAHMDRLGRLSHPNLLPLVAYYYTKEEKLFISDFVENGSLATHLHGMSHFMILNLLLALFSFYFFLNLIPLIDSHLDICFETIFGHYLKVLACLWFTSLR